MATKMETKMETVKLYNTKTEKMEVFNPTDDLEIGMSVCVSDARTAVVFDTLHRYLRHLGYDVKCVSNLTHFSDKVINQGSKCEKNPSELNSQHFEDFLSHTRALQCLPTDHQPNSVDEYIVHIIDMINKIIAKDIGYVVDGDVFFSVNKSPNCYCPWMQQLFKKLLLSGQQLDDGDPKKRNPADFALWKATKPGEPNWGSPWGPGRPGCHIWCSAMSTHYLSPRFDILGGGAYLKSPHHEHVIAQTCAAFEDSGVTYLLHNEPVTNNNVEMGGLKKKKKKNVEMGNSLNNSVTIKNIMAKYHPLALRYFLMSAHYRSPLTYSVSHLESSSDALGFVYQTLKDLTEALPRLQAELSEDGGKYNQDAMAKEKIGKLKVHVRNHMSEDLNTVNIFRGAFEDMIRFINKVLIQHKTWKKKRLMPMVVSLVEVKKAVEEVLEVLGLALTTGSYGEFLEEMKVIKIARMKLGTEENGIDFESCYKTAKKEFLRTWKVIVELMEFITPAGNAVYYVRKSLDSEVEARNEFALMLSLKDAIGVVQCKGTSIHELSLRGKTFYGFYMEYASAGTLWDEIQRHPVLPIASVRHFTRMILQALKSIHGAGYVHGDLHPGNVLLFHCVEGLEVKICDFGRAKEIGDSSWWSSQSCYLGHYLIMSPESVRDGTTNEGLDVWAVGHLMEEMLTKSTLANEEATDFKNKCLVPEPERRATVTELLEHNFLTSF